MSGNNLPATKPESSLAIQPIGTRQMVQPSKAAAQFLGIQPKDLSEAMSLAKLIASSNLCPEAYYGKPGDVLLVGAYAAEIGMSWLQGLMNTYVVNRRVAIYGDIMFALLHACPAFEYLHDAWDPETGTATCRIKRRGKPERVESFSYEQAERAGFIDGKNGHTYKKFPKDMLTWKARWRAARPEFADVFHGMYIVEEAMDLPPPGSGIEEPAPIATPRALGDVVDAFLEPPPQKGAGRAPDAQAPDVDPTATTTVESCKEKTWKDRKTSKTGVWWEIKTGDGRTMGTSVEARAKKAKRAIEEGLPVVVTSEPGQVAGTLQLVDISLAIPERDAPPPDAPADEKAGE